MNDETKYMVLSEADYAEAVDKKVLRNFELGVHSLERAGELASNAAAGYRRVMLVLQLKPVERHRPKTDITVERL
jgi:hypothetical protein